MNVHVAEFHETEEKRKGAGTFGFLMTLKMHALYEKCQQKDVRIELAPNYDSRRALTMEFQHGSRAAFEKQFARHRKLLYGFFERRLNEAARARISLRKLSSR